MVEPALSPPLARARPPAQRGRGRGRGRAGGGVVGAAACGVVRGGSAGRPRRGGTMELRAQPRRRRRDPGPVSARCGRTGCLVLAPSLFEFGRAAAPGQGPGAGRVSTAPRPAKLLQRVGRAREGGRAHCGPRRRPAPCPASRCIVAAVCCASPGFPQPLSPAPPPALRPRRCRVRTTRAAGQAATMPASGGARASARAPASAQAPLSAPRAARRPGHSHPSWPRAPLPSAGPAPRVCRAGPALATLSFALRAPLRPRALRPVPPLPGSRPQRLGSPSTGKGIGQPGTLQGERRGRRAGSRSAWMDQPRETR